MVEVGPILVLSQDEFYAGTSISEWRAISSRVEILKLVKLDDIESQNQCDICRESFGPSDDGKSGEKPVSLPCGHIFGKDCISAWIARNEVIALPPVETVFTCPKCRKEFTTPVERWELGDIVSQAQKIAARLRFWDLVYERLGILRSVEEEECRNVLWQFVEEQNTEQNKERWDIWRSRYDFLAQQSGLQFALHQDRLDAVPVQRDLCDAIFNLACYGANDGSDKYYAESYEDRLIPMWCWQFEKYIRPQSPSFNFFEHSQSDGRRPRIGPWRRALFKRIVNDLKIYADESIDRALRNPSVINMLFPVFDNPTGNLT